MFTTNCRRFAGLILCIVLTLIATFPAVAAESGGNRQDQEPDPIMNGFIDLVETLEDIRTTITELPAVESKLPLLLSGRIMFSKTQNMLSFEILGNPILEGMMLIIDNQEEVVYLLSPSTDQAMRMTAEVAAAQLSVMGIGKGDTDSLMAGFAQLLPVNILSSFELEPLGLAKEDDKSYYLIKLTQKNEARGEAGPDDYSVVSIDATTYYLCRLEQYSGGKSSGAFVLTDSSYNTGLTRSDFIAPLQGKSIVDYF